jgi:hypothetical protein
MSTLQHGNDTIHTGIKDREAMNTMMKNAVTEFDVFP